MAPSNWFKTKPFAVRFNPGWNSFEHIFWVWLGDGKNQAAHRQFTQAETLRDLGQTSLRQRTGLRAPASLKIFPKELPWLDCC